MKKRIKVDGLSHPVFMRLWWLVIVHVAVTSLIACRQSVNAENRHELAAAHALAAEHPSEALARANRLRERLRTWPEAHLLAGRLYAIDGNLDAAKEALGRVLDLAPEHRPGALWYSRVAAAAVDPDAIEEARRVLEAQIAEDPGDVRLYHALGTLLEADGEVPGALGAYQLGIERLDEIARLHLDAARIYYRLGLTDRAERRALTATKLSGETGGPVYDAANDLRRRIDGGRL